MSYIESLERAIEKAHGVKCAYLETIPVKEIFNGKVVWEGEVEVFSLKDHPKSKKCYAWSHLIGDKDQNKRFVTVLEIPPVNSPETAVRASIISEYKTHKD